MNKRLYATDIQILIDAGGRKKCTALGGRNFSRKWKSALKLNRMGLVYLWGAPEFECLTLTEQGKETRRALRRIRKVKR